MTILSLQRKDTLVRQCHSDERAYLVREIRSIARELGMVIPFYSPMAIWLIHGEAAVSELRKFFSFLCGELIKREGEL